MVSLPISCMSVLPDSPGFIHLLRKCLRARTTIKSSILTTYLCMKDTGSRRWYRKRNTDHFGTSLLQLLLAYASNQAARARRLVREKTIIDDSPVAQVGWSLCFLQRTYGLRDLSIIIRAHPLQGSQKKVCSFQIRGNTSLKV